MDGARIAEVQAMEVSQNVQGGFLTHRNRQENRVTGMMKCVSWATTIGERRTIHFITAMKSHATMWDK